MDVPGGEEGRSTTKRTPRFRESGVKVDSNLYVYGGFTVSTPEETSHRGVSSRKVLLPFHMCSPDLVPPSEVLTCEDDDRFTGGQILYTANHSCAVLTGLTPNYGLPTSSPRPCLFYVASSEGSIRTETKELKMEREFPEREVGDDGRTVRGSPGPKGNSNTGISLLGWGRVDVVRH